MQDSQPLKNALFNACLEFVDSRLNAITHTINEIQVSLTSETKSSAGDKHETGRAMLQLEREKAGNQLAEIKKTKEILFKIDVLKSISQVGLGSVVYTNKANYFIAISAGELTVNNTKFYAISAQTPIGKLLMGKAVNSKIKFRDDVFILEKIF